MLKGKLAVTADSNDEPAEGTAEILSGLTVTPSKAQQTIHCAGKVMGGNIVINKVPSSFVNVSGGSYLVNGSSLGALVNRGVTNYYPRVTRGSSVTTSGGTQIWTGTVSSWTTAELSEVSSGYYYFGGYYNHDALTFKGSIDLTPFTSLTAVFEIASQSSSNFDVYVVSTNKSTVSRYFVSSMSYSSGGTNRATRTVTIPLSGVNGHHYICLHGYHGNGISGTSLRSLRLS